MAEGWELCCIEDEKLSDYGLGVFCSPSLTEKCCLREGIVYSMIY